MEVAVMNAGIQLAVSGLVWALKWAATRESLGREPSAEDVASQWKRSVRTTYREKAAFKAAFPTLKSPSKIFEDPVARAKVTELLTKDGGENKRKKLEDISDLSVLELGLVKADV
jgi:aminopeptidase N